MTVAAYDAPPTGVEGVPLARWVAIASAAANLADRIAATEFVPEAMRDNPAVITAAIMYGDELGVGPMQALAGINVIKGKPSPSSELMRALVFRAGHSMRVLKSDGETCRVVGQRRGERESTVIEWSISMARAAGLVDSNPVWRRYPRAMLLARATSELCRVMFPDVVKGLGHVADDESTAEGFDDWASTATGEPSEPPKRTERITRGTAPSAEGLRDARPIADTPLPPPIAEPLPTTPPDDGPTYPQEPPTGDERPEGWPVGVSQPPLPDMPPKPPTVPAAAGDPSTGAVPPVPAAVPPPEPADLGAGPIGTGKLLATVHTLFADIGLREESDRPLKLAILSRIVGRKVASSKLLTRREGLTVVRVLNDMAQELLTFGINPDGTVDIYPPNEREQEK